MGQKDIFDCHLPIFLNVSGNVGDVSQTSLLPLGAQLSLVRNRFSFLHPHYCCILFRALLLYASLTFWRTLRLFASSNCSHKVMYWHHAGLLVGSGGWANWWASSIGGHRHQSQCRRYPISDIDICYSDIGDK
jgi:hypothetical protein